MNLKKTLSIILTLSVFLTPSFSLAATCAKEGYTVFFLNGVWNKDEKVVADNTEYFKNTYSKKKVFLRF